VFHNLNSNAGNLLQHLGQTFGPPTQFGKRCCQHSQYRYLVHSAGGVQIGPEGSFQRRQGHLVEPEGTHERILLDPLYEILTASQDPRLRPSEELVAAKKDQVGPGCDRVARDRFTVKPELVEVNQSAAADIVDYWHTPLFAPR